MLGKLMKYEIKATGRSLLPLYGALFAFMLITKLFGGGRGFTGELKIPAGISMAAYVSIMIAILVVTALLMIQRFYRNLLSDEGYLMLTLPVKPWMHIASKTIVSVLWVLASGFVMMVSIMILAATKDMWAALFESIPQFFEYFNREFGAEGYLFGAEVILVLLTQLILFILMVYASISVGHLSAKRRILSAFGAFLGFSILSQIIEATGAKLLPDFGPHLMSEWINFGMPHWLLRLAIGFNLVFAATYFIITNYILKNKLNLE